MTASKLWIPAGLIWPDIRGWLTIDLEGLLADASQEGE